MADTKNDAQRLEMLFRSAHACISINTHEEAEAVDAVRTAAMELVLPIWVWSINRGVSDGLLAESPPVPDTSHPAAGLYHLSQMKVRSVAVLLDVGTHLKDARTLRMLRDTIDTFARLDSHLVLVDHEGNLPEVVKAIATRFELSLPEEAEIAEIVRETLRDRNQRSRITVEIKRSELDAVVRGLRGLNRRHVRQLVLDACADDAKFCGEDLPRILAAKRAHLQGGGLLEYVETPITLDEVGGLRRLKYWLEHRKLSLSDEAIAFGLQPPRGILMLGVQGAGKSLSAKAVATAWQRPLLRMDVGVLYDRYIGESERKLRESLQQAERMAPIVLWIDEIEKAFASAANQSNDGGLSRRMFATILTWMQEHRSPVFIIATANDIEALPPELLRKGRFDEIFFVDLPDDDARQHIFAIHLRKRKRDPKRFDLPRLAHAATGFSGAEIEQAVISAMHDAFAKSAELTTDGLLAAIKASPPLSVTMAERIEALREWSKGRCVPAD
jgi:AAA+ superfamily predicted ATPase